MTGAPSRQRVERSLRRVAQLRTLFRRLPHLPSPREARSIVAFDEFIAGTRAECSREALATGMRAAFRRGDANAILLAVTRFDELREDPKLHPYYYWALQALDDSALAARSLELPRD